MKRPDADYWKEKLQLANHVEGGSFREVYRSPVLLSKSGLPETFRNDRNVSTSIYFLLEKGQFSAFHRIASDELWHFYYGDTLVIYEIEIGLGNLMETRLGDNPEKGEVFQTVVKAGNWFASQVTNGAEYALVGCTVAPGFDFEDFELADRRELTEQFPQHRQLIQSLTR